MKSSTRWLQLIGLVLIFSQFENGNLVSGAAVMSVDFGTEWMKIGVVSPGVPMEIVLNKESKRKTPIAISFRHGERLIGEDALGIGVRFPSSTYSYFLDLLGKRMNNPMVQLYQKRFPYHKLVEDVDRGTVLFEQPSESGAESIFYSPEELLSMILTQAREYAQDFTHQPIKEAVLTVPPYFNQAERRAVLHAAELANLRVLQLINTNTASALNYGIFRRKDFNETSQHILLYDMGAGSTVATVVSYQVVKIKEKGMVEINPQLSVLGVGYDRTLGGLEMQLRLRDFLAHAFNNMKKTKTDVFTNPRALAKLFKEAGRLKNVLSANSDHYAQIEGLLDEKDFRLQVSRSQFEELCSDLFDRVSKPVAQALSSAALTMDVIDQVILVGAGTRVPKVQEKLQEFVNRELGKSLNTDEAGAMGAVYRAAELSTGFKVKKFVIKDAVIFPILVDFEREIENEDGTKTLKIIRRTLFSHMNPYPQKKILTFNKHSQDFSFYVSYGELPVSAQEAAAVGSVNITKVELSGVGAAISKNLGTGTSTETGPNGAAGTGAGEIESKGVKAHFNMDDSGIFSLSLVEAVFEKNSTVIESEDGEDTKNAFEKLGSAFSKLFSSGTDEPVGAGTKEKEPENTENSESEPAAPNKSENETGPGAGGESAKEGSETDSKLNGTSGNENSTSGASAKKSKLVVIKEPLGVTTHMLDIINLDGEKFKISSDKLKQLNDADKKRVLREKARNNLESFVSDMQDKVVNEDYEKFLTEEEREKIGKSCSDVSDWLYEDGSEAPKETYEDKLKELKHLTKDFMDRLREWKERPDALEALDKMLNISLGFLESSKILPEDQQYFTPIEISTLEKIVKETLEWRTEKLDEQSKSPLSQPPALSVRMIAERIDSLDREVKYMLNKARVEKLKKQREEAEGKAQAQANASQAENKTSPKSKSKSKKDKKKESTDSQAEENKIDDENQITSSTDDTTTNNNETFTQDPEPTKSSSNTNDEHTEL